MVTKQLNIKNRTYYFWIDFINLKDFDPKLLKLDKKSSMEINIYFISYVTKKSEYNINSVNTLYLLVAKLDGFVEEENGNRYLNISLTHNNNNELLIKDAEFWSRIKDQIKKINNDSVAEYGKDYMNIKFNSDDNYH